MFDPLGPTFLELTHQALASTRHGYDLLAPKFDWTPFRTPEWLLDAVAPHFDELNVSRAIDLCCGTGAAIPLLQRVSSDLVVGADFSLGMLAEARSRPRSGAGAARSGRAGGGLPPARSVFASTDGKPPASGDPRSAAPAPLLGERPRTFLIQQDALALGFAATFDLATIFGALGHLRPAVQPQFLAQARSCLVPGGTLAFVTAPIPPPWSLSLWLAAAFDATMWLRNRLWRPPFYMYYLAWPLPRALRLLRENGFAPEVRTLGPHRPLSRLRLVLARRQ
ncbi:MAG TPA: methyltransferase domain-containing protein [Thermoanaerobaculia bacterium]|nr:methyltransferase domain-containing protein [Thermoanaerobaculia bacterium]